MTRIRRIRSLAVLLSLCALLFAQMALAVYACPGALKAAEVARMAEAGLPCVEEMSQAIDQTQPGLCHGHCQSGQSAVDNPPPAPALAAASQLGAVLTVTLPAAPNAGAGPPQPLLRRAAGPPLAIRNCCLRT